MNYQALTIGPIYKAGQKAESTKGLWAASYLFSFLMKTIIEKLVEQGVAKDAFVIPLVSDPNLFAPRKGAGLFPDRLIFKTEDADFAKLKKALEEAIGVFVSETKEAIKSQLTENKQQVLPTFDADYSNYLQKYLLLYAISKNLSDSANEIEECNKSLSVLELQQPVMAEQTIDYFYYLLEGINRTQLPRKAGLSNGRFPSIFEISSKELRLKSNDDYDFVIENYLANEDEKEIIDNLKDFFPNNFKRRHKYIAIVNADGDNMGKAVEQINKKDKTLVRKVDKLLLDFNIASVDKIQLYGGKSIYLGGDDLLFFAPITYGEDKTVFKLADDISKDYNAKFKTLFDECLTTDPDFWKDEEGNNITPPTLSFGISISYYKYPMFEAIESAAKLLHQAKEDSKNAVAFQVLKHSGQYFGARISKANDTYSTYFITTLNKAIEDDSFLSSIQFQLNATAHVIEAALPYGKQALTNYFDNFFNEPVHGLKKDFLDSVCDFLWQAYQDTSDAELTLQTVYSTLRTFQFMNQKDNDDE